jgi:hypothetical protein
MIVLAVKVPCKCKEVTDIFLMFVMLLQELV